MTYFRPRCSSVLDASYRHVPRQKVRAVFSVQERIAAFEENMDAANTTTRSFRSPKPAFEGRFPAPLTQNMKSSSLSMPSPSFRPAQTQRSSMQFHQKNMTMKSAMKANTDIYSNTGASFTSSMQSWNSFTRTESMKLVKSETQQSKVTSFSKEVHRNSKVSLAQQNTVRKEQSFIYSNDRVENIISAKSPKLPEREKPNYMRAYGAQNKVQRESTNPSVPRRGLPAVYALGKPPPKPNRPPSVDIRRFRRNIKSLKDAQDGTKIPPPVAPRPKPPPLRSCPSSNHAAALTQQVDEDDNYDDVGIMNPPPLPEDHPLKRTEEELSEDAYDDTDNICVEQAEKSKRNQESNSGKDDTNHGKVTGKKQAKEKEVKAKKEKKKQQKQEKSKEAKDKEAQKKSKIQGHVHIIKKGKALIGLKGGKSDLSLNQEEIVEVVHNTDDSEKTESVDAGHDEIKEEKEDAECDIYDDVGVPVEVCSEPTVQNPEEEEDDNQKEENISLLQTHTHHPTAAQYDLYDTDHIHDDVEEATDIYVVPTK